MNIPYKMCPTLVREFLLYLETIKGRSRTTVYGYYVDLHTFFTFMVHHKKSTAPLPSLDVAFMREITLLDVYEFLHYSATQRANEPCARARKATAIRMFFKYLTVQRRYFENNPVEHLESPKLKKSLPKYLTLEDCHTFLRAIEGKNKERDVCIVVFFLNCGMRLSELCGINLTDFHNNTLVLRGKGAKERIVYLNAACLQALETYLLVRNLQLSATKQIEALFLSSTTNTRLSGRQVERIVEKHLQKSGLAGLGYSPHKLRHTAATLMYQHGEVDVRVLQEILGHENLGTTQIYTHISSKQLEDATNKNPLATSTY